MHSGRVSRHRSMGLAKKQRKAQFTLWARDVTNHKRQQFKPRIETKQWKTNYVLPLNALPRDKSHHKCYPMLPGWNYPLHGYKVTRQCNPNICDPVIELRHNQRPRYFPHFPFMATRVTVDVFLGQATWTNAERAVCNRKVLFWVISAFCSVQQKQA